VTLARWLDTAGAEKMIADGIRRAARHGDDVAAHFVAAPSLGRGRKQQIGVHRKARGGDGSRRISRT
jgi:hypothetical protein